MLEIRSAIVRSIVLTAALVVALASGQASAQYSVTTPGTYGDQLFFFYDARTDRVPFLAVSNFAVETIDVEVAYYSQDMTKVLAAEMRKITGMGHVIIDPTLLAPVKGHAGLAVVTPMAGNPLRPVVPPSQTPSIDTPPLFGSFTLANRKLGAGFGQNPFGRIAVDGSGKRAIPGTIVDGNIVGYQNFDPDQLVIPTYFDPASLSPASLDGNRIFLAAFRDDYTGGAWSLKPLDVAMNVFFDDRDGKQATPGTSISVKGVRLDNLQGLAGSGSLTDSGKVSFFVLSPLGLEENVFGVFSQALGTYSIGQRMPGFRMKRLI